MNKHKVVHGHGTAKHNLPINRCFACGPDNPDGMHLKFVYDEATHRFRCKFRLPNRYWGPPKHAHGGIIATILDEAMGKVNKIRQVIAVTSEMTVNYLKPVPLGKWLVAEGWEEKVEGREHYNLAEIRNESGEVLARSRGKFIAVDPERMFAKYLAKSARVKR
ncbi:MAG TPA: PaaI family thioesterase [Terriglobales bacterium]|nr:PaaI family thioesterase [Terriglobales bacterium]